MKKFVKLTALSVILGLSSSVALAQDKIGVINGEYLFSHHPDLQQLIQNMNKKLKGPTEKLIAEKKAIEEKHTKYLKELDDKATQLAQEVSKKVKELKKVQPKLRAKEIKKRYDNILKFEQTENTKISKLAEKHQNELKKLHDEYQQKVIALQKETNKLNMDIKNRLTKDIDVAINKIAKAKKYSLILDGNAVVFADDTKNLTDEVLKTLSTTASKSTKAE